ncbi:hypothetical protein GE09DRAFT_1160301 [Coniochaeta sp. 2T2.1]|nr:hypothetical protein GE09DRAFT_1160301 [Coniochaeta sp. 2T2.1]
MVLRSRKTNADSLVPAVTYIHRLHSSGKGSQILLHIFSDGGSIRAVCLAEAYLAKTGRWLPVAAAVLDSTPGTARYAANVLAFRRSLPDNKLTRAVGLPVGAASLAVIWLLFRVFIGMEQNVISITRRALNDTRLWDLAAMTRTYVFSQADDLINWKDVEDHATEAAEKSGTTSMLVRYTNSGHCCHARDNAESYWSAVKWTWAMRDVEGSQVAQARMEAIVSG